MSEDDFIAGLTQAVKREVVSRYLKDRRVLEEEIAILNEDVCSLHGDDCSLDYMIDRLAGALFSLEAARDYFALAGLAPPERLPDPPTGQARPLGLTLCGRYKNLVDSLYQAVYRKNQALNKETEDTAKLLAEVNRDIKHFESVNDVLALTSYLRSLDLTGLQKAKLLGENFTFSEREGLVGSLAFRPVKAESLELPSSRELAEPGRQKGATAKLLKKICRENRAKIPPLWENP